MPINEVGNDMSLHGSVFVIMRAMANASTDTVMSVFVMYRTTERSHWKQQLFHVLRLKRELSCGSMLMLRPGGGGCGGKCTIASSGGVDICFVC